MIFINTRPESRAKPLTSFLQSQSITVLELPLLKLIPCELSQQDQQNLAHINAYHALIFISETAFHYFFDFIQSHQIRLNPNLPVITVGQKTSQILKNAWQKLYSTSPSLITPSQFNLSENNEGLLQLPFIQNLKKGDKILILKGKAGRDLLKNSLLEKGVIVDTVDFYQRIFPLSSEQIFQQFMQNHELSEKIIVPITSLTAWQHWQKLLLMFPDKPLNVHYLVLQSRIAETVKDTTLNFTILASLKPNEILEELKILA